MRSIAARPPLRRAGALALLSLPLLLGACIRDAPLATDDAAPARESSTAPGICDGTSRIVLSARLAGGGQQFSGTEVLYENGHSYLYVTGTCRYFVWPPDRHTWSGPREGTLDAEQASTLARQLHLDAWDRLDGNHVGERIADGSALVLESLTAAVSCSGCRNAGPSELVDADRRYAGILGDLWTRGTPLASTSLRIRALLLDSSMLVPSACTSAEPWTWAPPVDRFAVAPSRDLPAYSPGDGVRLDDPSTLAALRGLRDALVATPPGVCPGSAYIRNPAGQLFQISFRESLPGEDARGLVRVGATVP